MAFDLGFKEKIISNVLSQMVNMKKVKQLVNIKMCRIISTLKAIKTKGYFRKIRIT